ncbi:MAG TPA: diaminopimelate epimerase [Verrucomicrobiae bacterium]|nr:diaminopimelate epimerase [Verrucomicrobiae bacterium]
MEPARQKGYFPGVVLEFTKMNGAGNDFVLIDNRSRQTELQPAQIVRLCDRHKGVGADGVILLVPCVSGKADWAWDFYNSDGSSAEMCGNGARCFARFVRRLTGGDGPISFETRAGVITALFKDSNVTVNLTPPKDLKLRQQVPLTLGVAKINSLDTGVPHAVLFVPDADKAMVSILGAEIRNHPHFAPKGTNVNFVQVLGQGRIRVRTYERGVEGETLACGTGVTASALITAELRAYPSPVQVQVQSGDTLEISFERSNGQFTQVGLTGPAEFAFEGRIEV